MTKVLLKPSVVRGSKISEHVSIEDMAHESSLFSNDLAGALKNGGDLTRKILGHIRADYGERMNRAQNAGLSPVIDVRVQRLMLGMFPSIPGWHCDAVPRPTYHDQPCFEALNPEAFHITCVVDTDETGEGVSNTEFLVQDMDFEYDEHGPIWQQLHRQIEALPEAKKLIINPGYLYAFTSKTPHRARPTVKRGWRYFFRLSMYHKPSIRNGTPNQQQVYILSEANGW